MNQNQYSYSIELWFVTMLYQQQGQVIDQARLKVLVYLLQGLLVLRQATLSGMGRGVLLSQPHPSCRGQLQRAQRLMKNPALDSWDPAAALFAYATQDLARVIIALDWTRDG